MKEYYQEISERYLNAYKVTTDESGRVMYIYEPKSARANECNININDIRDCAYESMRSFSVLRLIYNAIFKKHLLQQELPCAEPYKMVNKFYRATSCKA